MGNGKLNITLSGLELDNPVIPASGTFGYGNEFRDYYDINILGSFSFKGTTREPRFGNPTPRIAECTAGMINAVGLQNPGIDAVIAEELPRLKPSSTNPSLPISAASRLRSTPIAASASTRKNRSVSSRSMSRAPTCGTAACRSALRPNVRLR